MVRALGITLVGGSTSTPTPSPSPQITPTFTPSPTATAIPEDEVSIIAAPNISKDGVPIQFLVELGQPAEIHLTLYTLLGEKVYEAEAPGSIGMNRLVWKLTNSAEANVASGLYVYAIRVSNRAVNYTKTGKVIVLH
jgi:hypothetical protein